MPTQRRIDRFDDQADLQTDFRRRLEALEALRGQAVPLGRRNLFDNAGFLVNQRKTIAPTGFYSVASPVAAEFYVDRWNIYAPSAIGVSMYPAYPDLLAYGYKGLIVDTSGNVKSSLAAGDFGFVRQTIEGRDLQHLAWGTAGAKPVTVSFDVLGGAGQTYIVELGTGSNRFISASYTTTGALQRIALTFPGDTGATIPNDSNGALAVNFWLASGSQYSGGASLGTSWHALGTGDNTRAFGCSNLWSVANQWRLSRPQLEVGSVATPFEDRSFSDELTRAQRHAYYPFWEAPSAVSTVADLGAGAANASNSAAFRVSFPTTMRAIPTYDANGSVAGDWQVFDATGLFAGSSGPILEVNSGTLNSVEVQIVTTTTGMTLYRPSRLLRNNNSINPGFVARL